MLIITGTGRSGTATVAGLLDGHHEFRVNYILNKYLLNRDPHAHPLHSIEKRIAAVMDLHQGIDHDSFIDSSNLYIHVIDAVYLLNPSVKFILTLRNGRDFVRSALSRRWHEQKIFGTVPQRDDPCFDIWKDMTPLQRNAWIWTFRNKKALEGLRIVPEKQKCTVKIEDIHKKDTLDLIETFTGIKIKDRKMAEQRLNANPAFDFPPPEEWTDLQKEEFSEIAGEMMKSLGYT